MRCNHCKRLVAVWTCTGAIALASGSAAFAELPRHPIFQTLEPTHEEVQPDPEEMPQSLKFGYAAAIRDGTAFVGMPDAFDHGRVAIFTQAASGWQRTGTLEVPANVTDFSFGKSLSFRDGYVMVGASGAVYVYKRGNGGWNLSQRLALPAGESDFAKAIHFESGILVVGAPKRGSNRHGTAYVYERNATGLFALRATLVPTDSQIGDAFGFDVSVAAGVIVIGAPDSDQRAGGAYVFRRNASGTWVQRQKLVSTETEPSDVFGTAVAIDKNMIVVGAPNVDFESPTSMPAGRAAGGAAYGFVPASGVFVETFKLRPRQDENPDYYHFGWDVAMFNKRIAVGAAQPRLNVIDGGYVHTYLRDGANVSALGLVEEPFQFESNSLALANQWLLVGLPYDGACFSVIGICVGEANLIDLRKFSH